MLISKTLPPALSFLVLTGGTVYNYAFSLNNTGIDTNFFEDLSVFNEEKKDSIFYQYIRNDQNNVREYFMYNSWNFWVKEGEKKENSVEEKSDETTAKEEKSFTGNGFVINMLTPESHGDSTGRVYAPNFDISTEKLRFLVGTSFSFAKKLFAGITNFQTEVNCATKTESSSNGGGGGDGGSSGGSGSGGGTGQNGCNGSSNKIPTLKEKGSASQNGKPGGRKRRSTGQSTDTKTLYVSHPYPTSKNDYYTQRYLYEIGDDTYSTKGNFLLHEPHYMKLESEDVKLLYTATDLKVNKKLLDINTYYNDKMSERLYEVFDQQNNLSSNVQNMSDQQGNSIEWQDKMENLPGLANTLKFFVDFAVLEIAIPTKDIKGPYLDYLKKLYSMSGRTKLPNLVTGGIDVNNYKTPSLVMGGWSKLNEQQESMEVMKNLWVTAKFKCNNGQTAQASRRKREADGGNENKSIDQIEVTTINTKDQFDKYFELYFSDKVDYETYRNSLNEEYLSQTTQDIQTSLKNNGCPKAEGAQNQSKKAEGAPNQGKKTEAVPNQAKKVEEPQKNDNYEYTNLELFPNSQGPVLYIKYQIKNNKTQHIYPEKQFAIFTGFQKKGTEALAKEAESIKGDLTRQNVKKYRTLVSNARPKAEWKEILFKYTYFDTRNINRLSLDAQILGNFDVDPDIQTEDISLIQKINNQDYLNLSHFLTVPNLDISQAKGAVVLSNWYQYRQELFGMYDGKKLWNNPFSKTRTEGKIMLFISPWRYDLFNYGNNLSKPTLADRLKDTQLDKKLVFRGIFKNSSSDSLGGLVASSK